MSDTVTAGSPFTVAERIENTNTRRQLVRVTQLDGPGGRRIFSVSYPLLIPAGKSLSFSVTYTFPAGVPPGEYSLTLTANSATATATTVVS